MRGEGRQEVRVTQLLLYPLLSVAKTRGSSQEETVAFVGVGWGRNTVEHYDACRHVGCTFARLSSPMVVSLICLCLVDVRISERAG